MADIPLQIGGNGFSNALALGTQIRNANLQGQKEQEEVNVLRRRSALGPDVQAAITGDSKALGRVAAVDPDYALKLGPIMETMDTKQRAKLQAGADFTYKGANAVLQADPADRPAVYRQVLAQGKALGHDLSSLPPEYSPQMDGQLRSFRQMAIPVLDQWKVEQDRPQPMSGGGAASPNSGAFANNSGNIRSTDPGNANGFATYPTPDAGAAAHVANYRAYVQQNPGITVGQALAKWSPPNENDTGGLTRTITSASGVDPNMPLSVLLQNPALAAKFLEAQTRLEKGGLPPGFTPEVFLRAAGGRAAPGVPGPVASPLPSPPGFTPAPTAPMPGAPTGLIPPGPPPAQMPNGMPGQPPIAQGDGGGQPQQPPPPKMIAPGDSSSDDMQAIVRSGYVKAGHNGVQMKGPTGHALYMHPGTKDTIEYIPPPVPTFGWQQNGGQLLPVPGGPNDPETMRREAEAKRAPQQPPAGYQPSPSGSGLAAIPGGPADPEVLTRNAEAKRIAAEKAIPQTVTKGMQENVNSLKQLDRVEAELTKHEGSVGGVGSTAASIIPGVGSLQNRFGDPEGTQLRALIADIGSMKIHDRSGAAVTASEFPRLKPFIPTIGDDAKTIRAKLANFRAEYTAILADTASYYGPENGFRAYTPATEYLEGKSRGEPGAPAPAAPRASAPAGGNGFLPMPRLSPEEAFKLPSGTPFITQDGRTQVRH